MATNVKYWYIRIYNNESNPKKKNEFTGIKTVDNMPILEPFLMYYKNKWIIASVIPHDDGYVVWFMEAGLWGNILQYKDNLAKELPSGYEFTIRV